MACPNDMSIPIWDDSAIAIDIAGNIIGKIKAAIELFRIFPLNALLT
jgi:hypothetical protein